MHMYMYIYTHTHLCNVITIKAGYYLILYLPMANIYLFAPRISPNKAQIISPRSLPISLARPSFGRSTLVPTIGVWETRHEIPKEYQNSVIFVR